MPQTEDRFELTLLHLWAALEEILKFFKLLQEFFARNESYILALSRVFIPQRLHETLPV
ncbi:MAG: hypothetical protein ACK4GM_04725 [Tabrizicola sp.]